MTWDTCTEAYAGMAHFLYNEHGCHSTDHIPHVFVTCCKWKRMVYSLQIFQKLYFIFLTISEQEEIVEEVGMFRADWSQMAERLRNRAITQKVAGSIPGRAKWRCVLGQGTSPYLPWGECPCTYCQSLWIRTPAKRKCRDKPWITYQATVTEISDHRKSMSGQQAEKKQTHWLIIMSN